jgi:hypothetical protein
VPSGYNQGGKILGFESSRTGVSDSTNGGQYDRHVYMDGSGFIRYGVWLGQSFTLKSNAALNDGNWHMVATTMGPGGMRLYIDGVLQASSTNTASETFTDGGWWRFGCGNLSGWTSTGGANEAWSGPNAPTAQQNYRLIGGSLDEVAIWQNTVFSCLRRACRGRGGLAREYRPRAVTLTLPATMVALAGSRPRPPRATRRSQHEEIP